jgi:hypothetical protein
MVLLDFGQLDQGSFSGLDHGIGRRFGSRWNLLIAPSAVNNFRNIFLDSFRDAQKSFQMKHKIAD